MGCEDGGAERVTCTTGGDVTNDVVVTFLKAGDDAFNVFTNTPLFTFEASWEVTLLYAFWGSV